jgi:hypothetical protein
MYCEDLAELKHLKNLYQQTPLEIAGFIEEILDDGKDQVIYYSHG